MSDDSAVWGPCPWCGDDNTFLLNTPRGPRRCARCRKYAAVILDRARLKTLKTMPVHNRRSRKKVPRGRGKRHADWRRRLSEE